MLDMQQQGLEYKKPIPLNKCGAFIWMELEDGKSNHQIAEEISGFYEIPIEEANEDVEQFIKQLREQDVFI